MAKAKPSKAAAPKDDMFDTSNGAATTTTDAELIAKTKADLKDKVDADKAVKAEAKAKIKAEKDEAAAAKKEQRAQAKAEREARLAELAKSGKSYTGSMLALADRVKQGVYVKSGTGQLRSNDELAIALDGVHPIDVITMAIDLLELPENPYHALNTGQMSMNLRNRMRGAIKKETLTIAEVKDYLTRNNITITKAISAEDKAKAKADKAAAAEAAKAAKAAKAVKPAEAAAA